MPTFIDLFAGIGGISLGLERAGFTCAAHVEIDPFCQRVLRKHWPGVPLFGDITTLDPDDLPRADLVAGGFPCQPVSAAGKRKAQEDPRWLWPHFARVLRSLRPSYALVENVPALLTVAGGGAAQEVFGDLAEMGFDAEWFVLSASAVGAPHLRERVFIVAHAGRPGLEGPGQLQDSPTESGTLPAHDPWWSGEPRIQRVAHGPPDRVDRLTAIGNAVVPAVAELVGRWILAGGRERRRLA